MEKYKGYLMVVIAASLWGISGTAAQHLFESAGISMKWLVSTRMIVSGILMIVFVSFGKSRKNVWSMWKSKNGILQFIIFGLAGMLAVQYSYFASIDLGNAAVATLLQYLAPIFIMVYYLLRYKKSPSRFEFVSIFLALLGTFLLLTNGNKENMTVPASCIIWGIVSGVSLAFYTLHSGKLIKQFPSIIVVGWGMIIGGIAISFFQAPWEVHPDNWSVATYALILFVILFGTLLPFYLFIDSLRFISAKESSLLACSEPLSSVISSVLCLGVPFGFFQGIGGVCIIIMVILLTLKPKYSIDIQTQNSIK